MVTFLSLFLGLIIGTHDVEVQPSDDVVKVEIYLDGRLKAELTGEPWKTEVDFGTKLLPHKLEAVAIDAAGEESDRAVQWINLVRSAAEASLSLDLDPEGRATKVSVAWQAVQGDEPRATRVEMDGAELAVDNIREFSLPRYDPNQLHFLRVELDFADEVVAVAEATFGGFYTDNVNTELTSIVIDVGSDRKIDLEELSGKFLIDGVPVEPVAVEKGDAEIIVVRDAEAQRELRRVFSKIRDSHGRSAPQNFHVRHYWTRPRESIVGEKRYLLYPHSGDEPLRSRELIASFLMHGAQPDNQTGSQLIVGASAVAGMASVSRNRRRAVLVVLGEPGNDRSYLTPHQLRSYFDAVDVPLEVWSTESAMWESLGDHGWGDISEIDVSWRVLRALDGLIDRLERQRVVWFGGRHVLQQIQVAPGAGFTRVGASVPEEDRDQKKSRKRSRRARNAESPNRGG